VNIEKLDEKEKVSKLRGRLESLRTERGAWEDQWKKAAIYFNPRREFLDDIDNTQVEVGKERFTDEPVYYNQMHANGMQGNLIGSSIKWFMLAFRNKQFDAVPYAKDWLEECEDTLYGVFHASSFYSSTAEFLLDGGSICTSCLYSEWNPVKDNIVFKAINPGQLFIAEDADGIVNTVFREFRMTGSQLQEKFGEKAITDDIRKELEDYKPDEKHRIIHAVFPRRSSDKAKKDSKSMPFASIYFLPDEEKIIFEGGYHEMPYLVWRYRKNAGEVYGRGPGLDFLRTAIRLNKFAAGKMKIADIATDPPLIANGNMKGRIRYNPGGITYVTNMDSIPKKWDLKGDYPISKDEVADLKQELKEGFLVDYFLMLNQSERQMTAYEVSEKQGEKATILGSVVGRLNQEFAHPLVARVFGILFRNGKLPHPPAELMQMGFKLDVHMIGPLAMSQKFYARSQGINRGLQSLSQISQLYPEVLDIVDGDTMARESLDATGMPQKIIRENIDIEQIRASRAKQQEAQQQLAMAGQMADMAPKLNQKVQPGSTLEEVNEQLKNAGVGKQ